MEEFEYDKIKKRKIRKEPIYIICCIVCLIIGVGVGYFLPVRQTQNNSESIYNEVVDIIDTYYYDMSDSDVSIEDRMLYGMTAGLGDRYTSYFTSEGSAEYNQSIEGSVVGIGIQYRTSYMGAIITRVFDDSPAKQSGLQEGDCITHIEGTSIAGLDNTQIREKVLGQQGTSFSITILRNGKSLNFKVTRQSIETSLNDEIRTINNKKIGFISLTTFGTSTVELFENALKEFKKEGVQYLCIDLRNNGGGYLDSVLQLLSYLVPKDEVIMMTQDKNNKVEEYKSEDCQKYEFEQGFILMNGNTASSSEVMIGALTELLHYQTIGETSYGKGLIQNQYTLSNSSVIKVTTRKWMTPQNNWIQDKGFEPHYEVKEDDIGNYMMDRLDKSYQYDDVDNQIVILQKILKTLDYDVDREDGYFSHKTQSALRQFEEDYGLDVNGIYSQDDAHVLLSVIAYQICYEDIDLGYQKVEELLR